MSNKDKTMQFGFGDGNELDALFGAARDSQPSLTDDNFTKVVMNSLPRMGFGRTVPAQPENTRRGLSFDLFGAVIGLLMAYFFIDQTSVVSYIVNLIPETFVVSPLHLIGFSFAFALTSVAAWWSVENSQI